LPCGALLIKTVIAIDLLVINFANLILKKTRREKKKEKRRKNEHEG
jgi:hypothetical protein